MSQKVLVAIGLFGLVLILPSSAQMLDRLNFHIGGGVSDPLNPTGSYAGVSGNFSAGAGYNINKSNSLIGDFTWSGLSPNLFVLQPVNAPFGSMNLYTLTANYRHSFDRIHGSPIGLYLISGGGWYYRHVSVDKNYTVPPFTACAPIYYWWGYGCNAGYIYSVTVASKGTSAGGVNAGIGFTIRLADTGWKFYTESRYHYAWSPNVPTTLALVTFGFRYN